MKYCEYCGKAIHDDAAFCSGCGKSCQSVTAASAHCQKCGYQLAADDQFCPSCGKPVGPAWEQQVMQQYISPTPTASKKRKMPKWILAVTAVFLVAAVVLGIFTFYGGFIKRVEFPTTSVSEDSIQDFLNVVLEKTTEDYAVHVLDLKHIYVTEPDVLRDNVQDDRTAVQIRLRDWINGPHKLDPGFVSLSIHSEGNMPGNQSKYFPEEQYEHARDIIIALEKTIAGKPQADTYLKSHSEMQKQAQQMENSVEASEGKEYHYWLTDKIEVTIDFICLTRTWYVSYNIKFHE